VYGILPSTYGMNTFQNTHQFDANFDFYSCRYAILELALTSICAVASDTESFEFVVSQHLRMSGVYWGLTALSVLGIDIIAEMNTDSIVDWVMSCQDDNGG
jgi:hypothetical protein